jgi:predicted O-linked N-acetylglucosamine transferase (SPINDLY family)
MACLIREVAAGRPVIVLQNLGLNWLPRWHYAVVVGYDMDQRVVVLHTGVNASRRVGLNTFVNTWKRSNYWGLGVMPADQMPQCVQESTFLNAALGLQIAGHTKAAVNAFANATARWPQSAHANIALGNALYRSGDVGKAVQSFYQAVRIEPRNADALNNLAHLLAESGELDKAEDMSLRAVAAGGPHKQVYLQTLEEIRLKRR